MLSFVICAYEILLHSKSLSQYEKTVFFFIFVVDNFGLGKNFDKNTNKAYLVEYLITEYSRAV